MARGPTSGRRDRRRTAARLRRASGADGGGRSRARVLGLPPRRCGRAARRGSFARRAGSRHVDVFQISPRPRASLERAAGGALHATARAASRGTAGRTGAGRTVTDGYYFVRFRTRLAGGRARHPPRRRCGAPNGPLQRRPLVLPPRELRHARRRTSSQRPVFGGTHSACRCTDRLPAHARRATCGCEVLRGGKRACAPFKARRDAAGARDRTGCAIRRRAPRAAATTAFRITVTRAAAGARWRR